LGIVRPMEESIYISKIFSLKKNIVEEDAVNISCFLSQILHQDPAAVDLFGKPFF
jgi:hypothetical protein